MFGKNIRFLRKKRKWTQRDVADLIGYKSSAAVNKWEVENRIPHYNTIRQLSEIFGVSEEDLMHVDLEKREAEQLRDIDNISIPAARGVPILGAICAGEGIDAEENFEGLFFVDNTIKADFCLSVKGDSMSPVIADGDTAFILKNCSYENGQVYAVVVKDETSAVLRKCYWQNGSLILEAFNKKYPPIISTEKETRIIGVCAGVYHVCR